MSAIHPFHGVVAAAARRPARGPVAAAVVPAARPSGTPARPWLHCVPLLRSPAAQTAAAAASSDDRAAAVATEWSRT
ncbi:hypothetical protein [Lysobacter sp. 1R34A]|uniref:hypothetical protein n=1 Tax=Lysobacter sp. 1R34A TaxID=3445786 RepID=UPI003EEB188B